MMLCTSCFTLVCQMSKRCDAMIPSRSYLVKYARSSKERPAVDASSAFCQQSHVTGPPPLRSCEKITKLTNHHANSLGKRRDFFFETLIFSQLLTCDVRGRNASNEQTHAILCSDFLDEVPVSDDLDLRVWTWHPCPVSRRTSRLRQLAAAGRHEVGLSGRLDCRHHFYLLGMRSPEKGPH